MEGRSRQLIVLCQRYQLRLGRRYRILLDISTYKEEKYEKITRMARRIAREVQKSKINAKLDPMTSDERRIVHNALSAMRNIKTESSGSGQKRQINIIYTEEKKTKVAEEEN